jgi:beta-galactosidase
MKQRIHGVVDLFGNRKPSYSALREESSPIESLKCSGNPNSFIATVRTRNSVPAYTLNGYKLRGVLYGFANIPLEFREASLSTLKPGESVSVSLHFKEKEGATRVEFDVVRPTGFSAIATMWTP